MFPSYIPHSVKNLLSRILYNVDLNNINDTLQCQTGIVNFFETNNEIYKLKAYLATENTFVNEHDKIEYGDFQTNITLALNVVSNITESDITPDVIIEPTCGVGNFIIASLEKFEKLKYIYAVEINEDYIWQTKFNILDFFINNPNKRPPQISITHQSVFDYDFDSIATKHYSNNILILGNPPWVTNSKLGALKSSNLPDKSNFKKHSGLDAITGKSNFDIAEYITIMMLNTFKNCNGYMTVLIKSSVIKNIVSDQVKNKYKISNIAKYIIDSKKEFNASVDSALFFCKLNANSEFVCKEYNFYTKEYYKTFGWIEDKIVSNLDEYISTSEIDGKCPFVWRQGVKHDCSSVMELYKEEGYYINKLGEKTVLEDGLIYALVKSSDLKGTIIRDSRLHTIITQYKVGQETTYIKTKYPKTYSYLSKNQNHFKERKSSIYKNKPDYSIFGIGDYSFKPYKVAISGLYKTFHFTLVLPINNKPLMLDDTCYFIGFDNLNHAAYTLILLNLETTAAFLKSITFPDSKRTFTKDILMRINIEGIIETTPLSLIQIQLDKLNKEFNLSLSMSNWEDYVNYAVSYNTKQNILF